jgi:colanic acid/amylovoran biosynthesis glycosyltransferase
VSQPVVASYCTTFLKPEMLHIYRQVTGLQRWKTFVVTRERSSEDRYPFDDVETVPAVRSNFLRRFWLKYIRREPPIVYRGEYGALARILDRRHADLLHVYFGHTGVHLLPFLQRWPRPAVVSFHGMDVMPREDKPGYAAKLTELLRFLPLVLARSDSLRDRIIRLGCPPEKIRINRTGIPMDDYPAVSRPFPSDGHWHFAQACRLIGKKGLDVSLRAFAGFCHRFPQSRFTIAGEGPLLAPLQQLASELGVSEKVHFAGFLGSAQLCRLYHQCHAFLHPSQTTADQNQEGVPNSMLEAMATGLPVLATLHGGIPEAIEDNVSGLLVEERDGDRLLDNLLRLAGEDGLWHRISQQAAASVRQQFEQGEQIRRLEAIYDEALALGPSPRHPPGP